MKEPIPEFSYIVDVNRIPVSGLILDLSADPEQCGALAARFKIPSLRHLSAHLVFKRINSSRVRVDGALNAEVEQICVVSLKPFVQRVEDTFSVVFSEGNDDTLRLNEIDLDMGEDDEIEYLPEGKADVGELVAQSLSLALDPFPRAPDAVFHQEDPDDSGTENPFSVLEKLKFK